jgi:adenylate kinase
MPNQTPTNLLITGIPASGKSYLAKKLAEETGAIVVHLDDVRQELSKDPKYTDAVNFYLNQDEEKYYTETTDEQRWQDLVNQSETLWPAFAKEINKYKDSEKPVIFECVNLLPHIVKANSDLPLVVLIGDGYENILKRNKKDPRWGNTEYLQELEAKNFFYTERPKYKSEAEKYNYPVFETADEAFEYCLELLD